MKHLFIFLTLLTCTYSNFIINPYVIAPSGSAELPTANLVAHYQPSGISRHGLDTVSGTASISDSAPKFGTGALVNVNGVDHIQEGVSSDWDHGTNDWTYETWVKNSLTEANRPMFANMTGGTMNATNIAIAIRVSSETIHAEVSDGVTLTTMTNGSTGWNDNAWHHFAFVRQGTTLRFYLDGIELSNSTSYTASLNSGKKMTWGSNEDGTSGVTQRFDEMRISSICRYPDGTTFTLATEAFTADSDTLYLNHCDGTNTGTRFYDSAQPSSSRHGDATVNGNAQLDTAQKKFGSASLLLDGTGDYIEYVNDGDFTFSSDFTIQMWVRFDVNNTEQAIFSAGDAMGGGDWNIFFRYQGDAGTPAMQFGIQSSVTNSIFSSSAFTATVGVWYHFAVVRNSGTITIYRDGADTGSQATSLINDKSTAPFWIGSFEASSTASQFIDGNIDDFRISPMAENPANFPPTQALGLDQYTVLYLPFDGLDASTTITDQAQGNSAFSLWVDDSGSEFDVTQSTGSEQPLGTPNALDGLTGATFDGSNDFLEASTIADWIFLHDGSDWTIFVIAEVDAGSTDCSYLGTNNGGSATTGINLRATPNSDGHTESGKFTISKGSVGNTIINFFLTDGTITTATPHYVMFRYEFGATGDDATAEVDESSAGSENTTNTPHSSGNPQAALRLGTDAANSTPFDGVILEIAIYNVALSTALIDQFNAYKNAKYPSLP